jgi:mono/diheme cytochrome c family protein
VEGRLLKKRVGLRFLLAGLTGALIIWRATAAAQPDFKPKGVDFNRDIRPIFSDNCFACHGPDEKQRIANLRLDTKEGAFADRGGYQVIMPGKAAESKLYQRISSKEPGNRMPPASFEQKLTEKQIELIRQWIDEGASWKTHWAFTPPVRPDLPKVKDGSWPRNEIDYFILTRLEREGLKPSPEADKTALLRRVTLDLTGLPPTAAEITTFLADSSKEAYEKRVDELLNSVHYGERMAMQWLDLARYADTHGYHIDSLRQMWHWRDWVIDAFNHNLPFDQFTIQQLAGDLLPNPTLAQRIATGFNRNHMINFEGGAIPEEYQTEYVVDRVEATANVWLGLTMGCARCHDHKYDPIKQKDFYQFFAFFNTIPEKGLDGVTGNAAPLLQLPTTDQQRQLEELNQQISAKENLLPEKELEALQKGWQQTRLATMPSPPREGLVAYYEFDGHLADTSGNYHHAKVTKGEVTYNFGTVRKAVDLDGETHLQFGNFSTLQGGQSFSLGFWFNARLISVGSKGRAILQQVDAPEGRGVEVALGDILKLPRMKRGAHVLVRLTQSAPENSIEIQTKEPIVFETWRNLTITYDGSRKAAGLRMYIDGKSVETEALKDHLTGPAQATSPLEAADKGKAIPYKGLLDDLRIYDRQLSSQEVDNLTIHQPIRVILTDLADKPFKWSNVLKDSSDSEKEQPAVAKEAKGEQELGEQRAKLTEYFLTYDAPQPIKQAYSDLKDLKARKADLEAVIQTTMVMQEMKKPRETFILGRGDYRNHGEKVTPHVPSWLSPMPKEAPANRWGLASWLVSPSHPLMARVTVNRYWQNYFGTGLVKTAEDFGSQGELPSHPELLDWLATEFIRSGWDIKAMQRLIVTSATYRQSSRVTPDLIERDPENRLLARGPRFRLPAEIVRDNALAVSGLLDDEVGGPSVYPYQPKGLWEEMAFGEIFTGQSYTPSSGKDLYRRSLYTTWKRTVPPPALSTFDAPDREKCTARRARTNTPLQALVLLNDPTYVEAARALAQRVIKEAGNDPVKRINLAFSLATARRPQPAEMEVLLQLAKRQQEDYRRKKELAQKLVGVGESEADKTLNVAELATWTTVASTILNLDETITKE